MSTAGLKSAAPALRAFHFACGDARAAGYYRFAGWRNSKPEYSRVDDADASIYWNSCGEWISYVENYRGSASLYRRAGSHNSPPLSDWVMEEGAGPPPTLLALGMQFVLPNALHGHLLSYKLKGAVAELGLDLSDIDLATLAMTDAHGLPIEGEPDWTSIKYPILCACFKKDAATGLDGDAKEVSAASMGAPGTGAGTRISSGGCLDVAAAGTAHPHAGGSDGRSDREREALESGHRSSGSAQTITNKMLSDSNHTHDGGAADKGASPPTPHECAGPEGSHALGVLRGGTVTRYACDEWLRPCRGGGDGRADRAPGIVSKSNVCQPLSSSMARLKVRPAVGQAPRTKVAVSAHMEWALEALRQIQDTDAAAFERALGVPAESYSSDAQGLLDMLTDIGPRLQARTEEVDADPIERELEKIIGLSQVKSQIRRLRKSLRVDVRRREAGVPVPSALPRHMVFMGNPGVGKTMVARLVARILRDVGAVKGGRFVEVQREDLVASYVGQTAPKARRKVAEAKGGVLFVDEAYRLTDTSEKDFGPEALEEIMKDLELGDPLVIVAGYPDKMQRFLDTNPGLRRRFRNFYNFADYTAREIADMFMLKVCGQEFFLEPGVTADVVSGMIADHTTESWRAEHNGGVASRLFDSAKAHLDERLCLERAKKWELQTLSAEDIRHAAYHLQGEAKPRI